MGSEVGALRTGVCRPPAPLSPECLVLDAAAWIEPASLGPGLVGRLLHLRCLAGEGQRALGPGEGADTACPLLLGRLGRPGA